MAGFGYQDLGAIILSVGTVRVSGYGEGGTISIEPVDEKWSSSVGGDGLAAYAKLRGNRQKVLITLRSDSRAYRQLMDLARNQFAAPALTPLPFAYENPANGDIVTSSHTVFKKWPTIDSQRDKVGDREFEIELPNPDIRYGQLAQSTVP